MKHIYPLALIVFLLGGFSQPSAQVFVEEKSKPTPADQRGFSVVIGMDGFGFGAAYRKALPGYFYLGAIDDPYYGAYITINKESQLFFLPVNVELKRQLFAEVIEENFQPHLFAQAGAIFGVNLPEKRFYESRNIPVPPKEFKVSYNFVIGIGADIISRQSAYLTIRPQFRYVYFPQAIAGQKDHSAFEISLEFGKRYLQKKEK